MGTENRYKMSQESLDKLKAELEDLETNKTKEVAEAIKEAIDDTVEITAPTTADDPSTMANSDFAIPRETHAASSLIEVGFCTNVVDAANLVNEEWQKSIANGIAEGIERFFDNLENP